MTDPDADRLTEIAELAEVVADEHCPTGRIDPEIIANNKKITFSYGRYADAFDGMLEHRWSRFHIYCNLDRVRQRTSGRARFTMCHELGHFYIDDHRNALRMGRVPGHGSSCDHQSRNPAEQEADHFACNLLMPANRFTAAAKKHTVGLDAVLSLQDSFGASITSTAIRYVSLNLGPCAVIKWTQGSEYCWKWLSKDTYQAGYRKTLEAIARVPTDSPTGRVLAGDRPPEGKRFHQAGTSAAAWFPYVTTGSDLDIILIEQAISLGDFGTLTFLFPERGRY